MSEAPDAIARLLERGAVTPSQVAECRAGCARPDDPAGVLQALLDRKYVERGELEALGLLAALPTRSVAAAGGIAQFGDSAARHAEPVGETGPVDLPRGVLRTGDLAALAKLGCVPGARAAPAGTGGVPSNHAASAAPGGVPSTLAPQDVQGGAPSTLAGTVAGKTLGRFTLLAELGRGGMGMVYRAHDPELGRTVAIKGLLRDEGGFDRVAVERFRREARAAAKLRHPGIVAVHGVGEVDGRAWLVMDEVAGKPLMEHMSERGRDPREAARLVARVADAIAYANREGVIHRDLKPDNVLVDSEGRPRVVDFGLALTLDSAERARLTASGAVLGTPCYMAPEQARGQIDRIGPWTDVYGLGALLYDALTGVPPFESPNVGDLLYRVSEVEPSPPSRSAPGVPADLDAICLRCLEKDPRRRFPDAGEVATELDRWLAGEPVRTRPRGPLDAARRFLVRRRGRIAAVLTVVVVVAAALLAAQEARRATRERTRRVLERVAHEVREFEDKTMSVRLTLEARRALAEQPLALLETVLREEPDLRVAHAWRGRALVLAERAAEADPEFDLACALAPEAAASWLLRGSELLERYSRSRGLPETEAGPGGMRLKVAREETPQERQWRERGLGDLDRMEGAAAADDATDAAGQSLGRGPASALGAVDAIERRIGRALAAARRGGPESCAAAVQLTEGLAHPRAWEIRGIALYLQSRFSVSAEAFRRTVESWPERASAWSMRGHALLAQALAEQAKGKDPRPALVEGMHAHDQAVARLPGDASALLLRGVVAVTLGAAEAAASGDGRAWFRRGIADFAEAGRMPAARGAARFNRAHATLLLSRAVAAAGQDPLPALREALAACDELLAAQPGHAMALSNRAGIRVDIARAEGAAGGDPLPGLEAALQDAAAAAAADAGNAWAQVHLAQARELRGEHLAARGADPREDLDAAVAAAERALAILPGLVDALYIRGASRLALAGALATRGLDPEDALRAAMADFGEVGRRAPERAGAWDQRAAAATSLALRMHQRNQDAREMLREAVGDAGRALAREPGRLSAQVNRSVAWLYLGQAEAVFGGDYEAALRSAIADADAALAVKPGYLPALGNRASAWLSLAMALQAHRRDAAEAFANAERDLLAAIAAGNVVAWLNLGRLRQQVGRIDEAIEAFEKGGRLVPQHRAWAEEQIRTLRAQKEKEGK